MKPDIEHQEIPAKVLIVDDEPANLMLLEALLDDVGIKTVKAASGLEAVEAVKKDDYALVIMDIQMPGLNGFETIKKIHSLNHIDFLPIIVVSAVYPVTEFQEYAIECGAVDFLPKPFNIKVLVGKVKVFCELYVQRKRVELYRNNLEEIVANRSLDLSNANGKLKQQIEFCKKQEIELKEAKERAEDADKLKTAFLNNLSHEIRTPLNAIVCFADLIAMPETDKKSAAEFSEQIKKSNRYLLNLVDNIINISKLESGTITLENSPLDVVLLLKYVFDYNLELLKNDENKYDNVNLLFNNKITTKSLYIYSDESFLQQIISILIENAIKFTEKGYVQLSANVEFTAADTANLIIEVSDTGIGISPSDQIVIFEKFRKGATSEFYNGAGVGLAIIKKQIELLNGKISLQSQLGKGSTFTVVLPVKLCNEG